MTAAGSRPPAKRRSLACSIPAEVYSRCGAGGTATFALPPGGPRRRRMPLEWRSAREANMRRRDLLKTALAAGTASLIPPIAAADDTRSAEGPAPAGSKAKPFHLKYAPHFGLFAAHAGPDFVDQLRFGADR